MSSTTSLLVITPPHINFRPPTPTTVTVTTFRPPHTTTKPKKLRHSTAKMSTTPTPTQLITSITKLIWGKSLPPQLLISTVRSTWSTIWQIMMSQLAPSDTSGSYTRPVSQFRKPNPTQLTSTRLHLYAALPCPWAHRTLIVRALKGLEHSIPVSIASPGLDGSWVFNNIPGPTLTRGINEATPSQGRGELTMTKLTQLIPTRDDVNGVGFQQTRDIKEIPSPTPSQGRDELTKTQLSQLTPNRDNVNGDIKDIPSATLTLDIDEVTPSQSQGESQGELTMTKLSQLTPTRDNVNGAKTVKDVYKMRKGGYNGRCTLPMLWDVENNEVVCNESYDIIELLNSSFNGSAKNPDLDLAPVELKGQIEEWNRVIYPNINNGVYRCGFAQSQEAYDTAVNQLFNALETVDNHLKSSRYLCGEKLTLADVCLFTTLIRFDLVYNVMFKCTKKKVVEYPSLYGYMRDIYQIPKVAETCNLEAMMDGYYKFLFPLNPGNISPVMPVSSDHEHLLQRHNRESLSTSQQSAQVLVS